MENAIETPSPAAESADSNVISLGIWRIESRIPEGLDRPVPSVPIPSPVLTLLQEQYATMRRAERADRNHYYALDDQAAAAETKWIDSRQRAVEMYRFLRQAGVEVRGVDQED